MKLGPFLRKKYTSFHEFLRRSSFIIDYSLWLILDPTKYTKIHTDKIDNILVVLVGEVERGNVGG
ncbi:MAG: hypothetical protein Q7S74_02845, partial [Nanoarchaeota archaeon]|nr:hypothetical protein [Nanoarchaeota archaeon]